MTDETRDIVKLAREALGDIDDQTCWRTFTAHPDSDPCIAMGIPEAMTIRAALDRLEALEKENERLEHRVVDLQQENERLRGELAWAVGDWLTEADDD